MDTKPMIVVTNPLLGDIIKDTLLQMQGEVSEAATKGEVPEWLEGK